MAVAPRAAALWVAVLFLCGCGTIANLETGARQGWKNAYIYGGVQRDVQSAGKWIDHSWTWGKNLDIIQDIGSVVGVVLVGIDMPLSAVADTLTLPATVPIAILNNPSARPNNAAATPWVYDFQLQRFRPSNDAAAPTAAAPPAAVAVQPK